MTANREFEEWFSAIWAGSDDKPVPEWMSPEWGEYIAQRQLALGAWDASRTSLAAEMGALEAIVPPIKSHPDQNFIPDRPQSEWAQPDDYKRFGWNACRAEVLRRLSAALATPQDQGRIDPEVTEKWENGELGRSEEFVGVIPKAQDVAHHQLNATQLATHETRESETQAAQEGGEAVAFLCENHRFKLSFDSKGRTASLSNFARELDQRWVALVAAEDDTHMRYTRPASDVGVDGSDTARLDYIERAFSGMTNRERYLPVQMIWGKGANGRTLREACDESMARAVALSQQKVEERK